MKKSKLSFWIAYRTASKGPSRFTAWIIGLSVLSLSLGVAVMIISSCLIEGFQRQISSKIFDFWGHIVLKDVRDNDLANDVFVYDSGGLLKALDSAKLMENSNIKLVQSTLITQGIIRSKEDFDGIAIKGINFDFSTGIFSNYITEGHIPLYNCLDQIMISATTAKRLELNQGDRCNLFLLRKGEQVARRCTISGIYKTGLEEFDSKVVFAPVFMIREMLDLPNGVISQIEVYVKDLNQLDMSRSFIDANLLPMEFYSSTVKEKYPNIFEWLELQNINKWVILSLMSLVCIVNLATSLLILMLERSKMIAVLKTLGASFGMIRNIFLIHALRILSFGILLGNILGIGLAYLQKHYHFIKLDETNYYLKSAPIYIDWMQLVIINLGALAVTIICMYIPAYFILTIKPAQTLQFQ